MHPFADTPQEFWKCHFGEGPACRVNAWEVLPAFGEQVKAGLGGTASPMASLVMQEENISPCKAKSYLPLTRVVHTHMSNRSAAELVIPTTQEELGGSL